MNAPKAIPGLMAVATVALALPSAASADRVVPPGNSAATQYTEAIPTAGGPTDTGKGSGQSGRTPAKSLGSRNAQRLQAQGREGEAAAAVATETAPAPAATTEAPEIGAPEQGGGATRGGGAHRRSTAAEPRTAIENPDGGSGLGETISQAAGASAPTGSDLLLPLAFAGAIAWAIAYLIRQRKKPTA
jgi:hypothetical protein